MKKLVFSLLCLLTVSPFASAQWTTTANGIQYSSGLVTIGNNATNGYKLDLVGRGRLWSNPGGWTAGLSFMNSNNTAERAFVGMGDDNHVGFFGWGLGNWGFVMNVNNGNVGIGTSAPAAKLQVAGTIDAQGFTVNGQPLATGSGGSSQWSNETTTGIISYNPNNATAKVGIGTSNPGGYTLAVAGKIGSWGEVRVLALNAAFPDYVIAPDYKLRPLSDVATYIQQHKHLPEVPSAAEVAEKGLGLSEMQLISIKKIEELTLYLIELQKQLEAVKQKNQTLEQQLQELQKPCRVGCPKSSNLLL